MCLVEESLTTVRPSCSTLKVFGPVEKGWSDSILVTGRGNSKSASAVIHRRYRNLNSLEACLPERPMAYLPHAAKNRLTRRALESTLRSRFYNPGDCVNRPTSCHVQSLQHHWIPRHARQRHSSSWYGEEKRRRRSPRDEKCATRISSKPARTQGLGAGAEKIRAHPCDGARAQDDQQKRGASGVKEGRRHRGLGLRDGGRIRSNGIDHS
jgi:hypothetical protein